MRLISQNGTVDVPYEQVGLTLSYKLNGQQTGIYAHCVGSESSNIMGTYYSKEKALMVMEMVRNAFCDGYTGFFQFPQDEDVTI